MGKLREKVSGTGTRALVVTDGNLRKMGILTRILEVLVDAGFLTASFAEVEPNPSWENILRGIAVAREFNPELIVGLGGGSAIDAAKAIWVFYAKPDLKSPREITPDVRLDLRKKARFVAIPSTSGTGSDVSWAFVVTETSTNKKLAVANEELVPDYSVLDPSIPTAMSRELTAGTGLDALTHAVEAYTSDYCTDFSDAVALQAIKLVFQWLPKACENAADSEARSKMHNAASLAGLGFSNSSVGLAHGLGHAIGAKLGIHHGRAVGMCLPHAVNFNSEVKRARYTEIVRSCGLKELADDGALTLIQSILKLKEQISEPNRLRDSGIINELFSASIEDMTKHAAKDPCTKANPRKASEEELRRLFWNVFEGKMD